MTLPDPDTSLLPSGMTVVDPPTTDGPPVFIAEELNPGNLDGAEFSGSGTGLGNGQLLKTSPIVTGTSGKFIIHYRFRNGPSGIRMGQARNIAVDDLEFTIGDGAYPSMRVWDTSDPSKFMDCNPGFGVGFLGLPDALNWKSGPLDWNALTWLIDVFGLTAVARCSIYLNGLPVDDPAVNLGYNSRGVESGGGIDNFDGGSLVNEFHLGGYASDSTTQNWMSGDQGLLKAWNGIGATDAEILEMYNNDLIPPTPPVPASATNMFKKSEIFVNNKRNEVALVDIALVRAGDSRDLTGTPDLTIFKYQDKHGNTVREQSRDYIIDIADYRTDTAELTPAKFDQIVETVDGVTYTYEVSSFNGEPHYIETGAYRTAYRVHTKLVKKV